MSVWPWGRGNTDPPPQPPVRTIRVSVWGTEGLLTNAVGILDPDDASPLLHSTVEGGRLAFTTILPEHGAWLSVSAPGYVTEQFRVVMVPDLNVQLQPTLPLLRTRGQFFETVSGDSYSVIGCSDFLLFARYVRGEDIIPVLRQRNALGFNLVRVFLGIKGGLGEFDPRPYLNQLPAFCGLLAGYGLRAEFTFGDWKRWCPDPIEQRALLKAVDETVPLAHLIEGMNEGLYLDNTADGLFGLYDMQLQDGRLWSLGSRIQDAGLMMPVKTHGTYHPARSADWPRKVGHNAMELQRNKPVISNECKRPDEDGFNAVNFFDAAANAALLCAGAVFHSQSGKASVLLTDAEMSCAEAWVAGANAVPLEYQMGSYTAGHLHDSVVEYRSGKWSHARLLGNKACLSVPQNHGGWVTKNGWRVVSQDRSVILLER